MELKEKVLGFIRRQRLVTAGQTLVLGVSGGADSVVLAHVVDELRHELSVTLHMAHFNHRLRRGSDRDQKFVERLAAQLNIPLTIGVRRGKALSGKVPEERARQWRFKFFAGVVRCLNADAVVLAHTQNDVAETVLMRMLRGSGLYGLRAILPERRIEGVKVIRPLMEVTRNEVEAYIRRRKLGHCTDETNVRTDYLRNKVRLELLPLLGREYNPQICAVLAGLAKTAGEDYDLLQESFLQRAKENLVTSKGKVKIGLNFLARQHTAMRRMFMRHAFERLTGDVKQMTFAHIAQAQEMLERAPVGSIVHWPRSVKVVKGRKYLEFTL